MKNEVYFISMSALTVDTIHRVNSVSIASQKLQTTAIVLSTRETLPSSEEGS